MNVILSIKPEFVERIFSGEKKYEYRKILFKQKVEVVYIYATSPISKIVGQFSVSDIIYDTPEKIWQLTKEQSGISKIFFDSYFKGKKKGVAIEICELLKYETAIPISDIVTQLKAPQSYLYTTLTLHQ